ncbi:HNH endonuclease [Devosia oryzisoli]|uniref:HNH endonuclease n=1 Tax=Devosia oryzisoli TaxID=2774138 RepID=UPI001AED5B40|nr:HNH endonuclease [Devosia oryzisoli]
MFRIQSLPSWPTKKTCEVGVIAAWQDIVRKEIEAGTGALIGMSVDQRGMRTALRIWFADLDERRGPFVELKPHGLKGYRATLGFGTFAGEIVRQIQRAGEEDVQLAQALVDSLAPDVELDLFGQERGQWRVHSGSFRLTATLRKTTESSDEAVARVSRDVVVPLMAAMAELIGYDLVEEDEGASSSEEGAILLATVRRRERNPRNRLLCIRLHGERCLCCGMEPRKLYGDAGDILEVHHLEALSLLAVPRPYDPGKDLAPLCPNCHRAVHTRRPVPLDLDDVRTFMEAAQNEHGPL